MTLFKEVWKRAKEDATEHYTVEQPFFNHAVRSLKDVWDTTLLRHPIVCSNGKDFNRHSCMLFDLCGTPGDDVFHENKMVTMFCYLWTKGDLDI